ncbi:anaphase promoting complex subunit cdc16 [Coelomomyces lativittatus]|nr:anaphase promoting complex subunit cdc16 [Coelomomyces lativittatus]KAJ1507705.1 anaphase promoting complex subunit cdc16 [Coelomomyces lativittatus]KAJ1513070.1 anaphase promoting complex subunit cdc16 [Coelomomyces lativittatus]
MTRQSNQTASLLSILRQRRDSSKEARQDIIAEFWAEQVISFSKDILDTYALCLILFNSQQYHRVLTHLYPLINISLSCRLLLLRSLLTLERYDEALDLIDAITSTSSVSLVKEPSKEDLLKTPRPTKNSSTTPSVTNTTDGDNSNDPDIVNDPIPMQPHEVHRKAVLWTLRGEIFIKKKQMLVAKACFHKALNYDVTAYDAFSYLTHFCLLSPQEELEWLQPSNFLSILPNAPSAVEWVFQLYLLQLSKSSFFSSSLAPTSFSSSPKSHSLLSPSSKSPFHAAKKKIEKLRAQFHAASDYWYVAYFHAEAAMASGAYGHAKAIFEPLIAKDPYHPTVLVSYLQCLSVLKDTSKLFQISQLLGNQLPNQAITAYATGCYYLSQPSRCSDAQSWFLTATQLQETMTHSWLGYAAASIENKNYDSVMSALSLASTYMPYSYLPSLYQARTAQWHRQFPLALAFYEKAYELCPDNIEVCTEFGLACLEDGKFNDALKFLKKAAKLLEIRPSPSTKLYMQIHFGLGKLFHKTNLDSQALKHLEIAISQDPFHPASEVFVLMGDIFLKQNNISRSVDLYHRALTLCPGDPAVTDKLNKAINLTSIMPQHNTEHGDLFNSQIQGTKSWLSRRPFETNFSTGEKRKRKSLS